MRTGQNQVHNFTVEWTAGKKHAIADALSRAPVFAAEDRTDILIRKVMEDILDPALKDLATHTTSDAEYQEVVDTLRKGKAIMTFTGIIWHRSIAANGMLWPWTMLRDF